MNQDFLREYFIYNSETGELIRRKKIHRASRIGEVLGTKHSGGYLQTYIHFKHWYIHRLAWIYENGDIPSQLVVDHINGIRTDNRISNLRLATRRENSRNTAISRIKKNIFQNSDTGYWTGQIPTIKSVRMTIGSYETKEDAEYVYNKIAPLFISSV